MAPPSSGDTFRAAGNGSAYPQIEPGSAGRRRRSEPNQLRRGCGPPNSRLLSLDLVAVLDAVCVPHNGSMTEAEARQCGSCNAVKPLDLFTRKARGARGNVCKSCHSTSEGKRKLALRALKQLDRTCADCEASISDRAPQATLCAPCVKRHRQDRSLGAGKGPVRRDASQVLRLLREGDSLESACLRAGVSHLTVTRRRAKDQKFDRALRDALEVSKSIRRRPCGTLGAYARGCRCRRCLDVRNEKTSVSRDRLRSTTGFDEVPHGLTGYLNYGCRCETCTRVAREAARGWQRKANDELLNQAHRHFTWWTSAELEIASRADLSSREVARMLGRTMWAVSTMRNRLRTEPATQYRAGQCSKLHG